MSSLNNYIMIMNFVTHKNKTKQKHAQKTKNHSILLKTNSWYLIEKDKLWQNVGVSIFKVKMAQIAFVSTIIT